jgi:hypothetical protein
MDAGRALADLLELSPEVEAAALFSRGDILGYAGIDDDTVGVIVGAAGQLLDGAGEIRSDGTRVTQVRAALGEGGFFVVREPEGERAAAAIATSRATPGLVFYDLKRALAATAEEEKPKPRRRRTKKAEEGAGDAA